jgi:hypothetical protein
MDHFHGAAGGHGVGTGQAARNAGWHVSHDGSFDQDDGCAICQFAAEGKMVPQPRPCVCGEGTVTYLATADRPPFSGHCDQPFYARGPPQV